MKRFLTRDKLSVGSVVGLDADESRHALKALRLKEGDEVLVIDGFGAEAEGKISSAGLDRIEIAILNVRELKRKINLELLQAPLKGPKMDWLVEKLTEIGVTTVHLARTQHTVAAGEKTDRWQRIAQSALKQSGNLLLPNFEPIKPLEEAILGLKGFRVLMKPGASLGLSQAIKGALANGATTIVLAIGPEGGFSQEEENFLIQAGFVPAALSLQVLRGETAAISALAIAAHSIDF